MATDRIIEHIERLREKPEHVRQRIALLTASGITGLVALTWMGAMATSGSLALKESTDEAAQPALVREPSTSFSSLMGAAGAAFDTTPDPDLSVVETRTSSTLDTRTQPANNTNKTVIPF